MTCTPRCELINSAQSLSPTSIYCLTKSLGGHIKRSRREQTDLNLARIVKMNCCWAITGVETMGTCAGICKWYAKSWLFYFLGFFLTLWQCYFCYLVIAHMLWRPESLMTAIFTIGSRGGLKNVISL